MRGLYGQGDRTAKSGETAAGVRGANAKGPARTKLPPTAGRSPAPGGMGAAFAAGGAALSAAKPPERPYAGVIAGSVVALLGLAWFYVATFVIIPAFAAQAYAIGQTPYAARYGELGDTFGDVLKAMLVRPDVVLRIVIQPLRLRYLFGLLAPVAFLPLLAPEFLLLSAPLLLANLLSSFPFQYSGELHYSAPLAPFFVAAGAAGLGRWLQRNRASVSSWRLPDRITRRVPAGAALALLLALGCAGVGTLGWQIAAGYTPIGREFWRSTPGGWPAVTAHQRLLARFIARIPPDAAVSATTDLYPHVSHRERLYQFPRLGDATWALVDVTGTTDRHPADVRAAIRADVGGRLGCRRCCGWLPAAGSRPREALICRTAFYDFARAPAAQPRLPFEVTYGDSA